ncbi:MULTISPECIES: hypothetical protein [unclassified Microcoleus]|uniref:hypothetical protein n=1 Tax=unclassified Microcoleus TaxID=2642155 RepID=UPI002FD224F6
MMSLQLRLFGGTKTAANLAATNEGPHAIDKSKMEAESLSQCCQRILKVMSTGGVVDTSTELSTPNIPSVASTKLSTKLSTRSEDSVVSTGIVDIVDKAVSSSLDPVIERMAAIEERLGKLSS